MVKILRSRRHRWRGVPLGGPLQRGCKFCFAAHDGKAKTHEIAAWLRPEIVLAGGKLLHRHLTHSERWRFRAQLRSRAAKLGHGARVNEDSRRPRPNSIVEPDKSRHHAGSV